MRIPSHRGAPDDASDDSDDDDDGTLAFGAAIFWLVSAIRVGGALAHGEAFGAEATLATFALFFVPALAYDRRLHAARATDAPRPRGPYRPR